MDFHVTVTTSSSGSQWVEPTLPPGASLSGAMEWANPVTRYLSWTPARGQDSLVYDFCLTVTDSKGIMTEGGFGLDFNQDYCIRSVSVAALSCANGRTCGSALHAACVHRQQIDGARHTDVRQVRLMCVSSTPASSLTKWHMCVFHLSRPRPQDRRTEVRVLHARGRVVVFGGRAVAHELARRVERKSPHLEPINAPSILRAADGADLPGHAA